MSMNLTESMITPLIPQNNFTINMINHNLNKTTSPAPVPPTQSTNTTNDYLMYDTGAVTHVCPLNYAEEYPLLPLDWSPPLRAASGTPLQLYGRRLIAYDFAGTLVNIMYYVTDVTYTILSGMRLSDAGYIGVMDALNPHLKLPNGNNFQLTRNGTHVYLTPRRLPYNEALATIVESRLDLHLDKTVMEDNCWQQKYLDNLDTTISATSSRPTYYHTDTWETNLPGKLVRRHKRLRRTLYTPVGSKDCPVDLESIALERVTYMEFSDGTTETRTDLDWTDEGVSNLMTDRHWKGTTTFKLRSDGTGKRLRGKTSDFRSTSLATSPADTSTDQPRTTIVTGTKQQQQQQQQQATTSTSTSSSSHTSPSQQRNLTQQRLIRAAGNMSPETFKQQLIKTFEQADYTTGLPRTSDYWKKLPTCWVIFHHEPRLALYVPRDALQGPTLQELGPERTSMVIPYLSLIHI